MKYIRINFNKLYESSSANDQQIINSAKALIKVFENYRFLYCSFFCDYHDRDGNYKAALCHDTLFNSGDCQAIINSTFYPIMDKKDLSRYVDDLSEMTDNRHYIEKYKNFVFDSLDNFEYMPTKSRNLFERTILGRCNKLIYGVFNYYIDKVKTSLNKQFPDENYKSDIDLFAADEQANDDYIKDLENKHLGVSATNAAFYKNMYNGWIINRVNDTMNTAKNNYFLQMRKKSNTENIIDSTDIIDIAKDAINFIAGTLKNAPEEFNTICESNKAKGPSYAYDEKIVRNVAYNYYTFFSNFADFIADAVSPIEKISLSIPTEIDFEESIIDKTSKIYTDDFVDKTVFAKKILAFPKSKLVEKGMFALSQAFKQDLQYACIDDPSDSMYDYDKHPNIIYNILHKYRDSSTEISPKEEARMYNNISCESLILLTIKLNSAIQNKNTADKNKCLNEIKKYFEGALLEKKLFTRITYEKFKANFDNMSNNEQIYYLLQLINLEDRSTVYGYAIFHLDEKLFGESISNAISLIESKFSAYKFLYKINQILYETGLETAVKDNDFKTFINNALNDKSLDKYIDYARQNKLFKLD